MVNELKLNFEDGYVGILNCTNSGVAEAAYRQIFLDLFLSKHMKISTL
jgi:hypothetical protein